MPWYAAMGLFVATAFTEILGCFLPMLWLRRGWTAWILVPGALSLVAFVWLLSLHPHAAGRTYAAYGGVYVGVAVLWLWLVERQRPDAGDVIGVLLMLAGSVVVLWTHRTSPPIP